MTVVSVGARRAPGLPLYPNPEPLHYGRVIGVVAVTEDRREQYVLDPVLSISMDLSTSQVSQATVTMLDEYGELRDGDAFRKRNIMYVGGLTLEVAVRETGKAAGRPVFVVTGRARAAQMMKRAKGALVRRKISPTAWVAAEAELAGARFFGQQTPEREQIVRATADPTAGGENESSWSTAERLAKEEGFIFFEAQNVVYFAQPTWLLDKLPRLHVHWGGYRSDTYVPATAPSARNREDGIATWRAYDNTRLVDEDEVPELSPGGGRLTQFYEDGSGRYDDGWTWDPERRMFRPRVVGGEETSEYLLALPELRESDNDETSEVTGTLSLAGESAAQLVPGRGVQLSGMGVYSGAYMVNSLRLEMGKNAPGTVGITTPVNPVAQGTPEAQEAAKTQKAEAKKETRDALDEQLERLRQCESGGNYKANTGNGYYGAYQFDLRTWQGLGYGGRPDQATAATQDAAARKLHAQRGWAPWPACSRKLGLR